MDNFNKIVSFVLGLIVVIVFLAIITGRLNLRSKISSGNQTKTSPTPTTIAYNKASSPSTVSKVIPTSMYNTKTAKTIPSTGSPTILLPLFFSSAAGGFFLKRIGKKS